MQLKRLLLHWNVGNINSYDYSEIFTKYNRLLFPGFLQARWVLLSCLLGSREPSSQEMPAW